MNDYNITAFIEAVKAVCEERGIAIGKLEEKIGLQRGSLSRMSVGKRTFKVSHAIAIANELEMYIDDLFFFDFKAHRLAQLKLKKAELEDELERLKGEMEDERI